MLAIMMSGGVYCPVSPRDSEHHLDLILQQTQSRFVLVHYLTETKFNNDIISYNIDSILSNSDAARYVDIERLSDIVVTTKNIAYISFSSGSTGTTKVVSFLIVRSQQNFIYIYTTI
jgi:acyl-CoA synthetase (AMP-forming)/AMP-acid ligase II